MSDSAAAIQQSLALVGAGKSAKELLSRFPLMQMTRAQSQQLLAWLLAAALTGPLDTREHIIREIANTFEYARHHIDSLPILTLLFLNSHLTLEQVRAVQAFFPEKTAIDYYLDVANLPTDTEALAMLVPLQPLLVNMTSSDWLTLLEAISDEDEDSGYTHPLLAQYFLQQQQESGFAPKPEWIKLRPSNLSPLPDINCDIPTPDRAVALLTADFDRNSVTISDSKRARSLIAVQYALASLQVKRQMIGHLCTFPDMDDTEHIRRLGPANMSHDHITGSGPCQRYGGCRMLTCCEYESETSDSLPHDIMMMDEHVTPVNWWRKRCDSCHTRIAKREYAVRQPLVGGGWRGCYCSFDCLPQTDELTTTLIEAVQQQLSDVGIYDAVLES
jgi:hypothetical protein